MKTSAEYINSIRNMKLNIYSLGEHYDCALDNPILVPSVESVAMTYALAEKEEYQDVMIAYSPYIRNRVNRFCHIHEGTEDLVNKVKMQRLLGSKTASCFQRCVGMDAINAVFSTTYDIDKKNGTHYHDRFTQYLKFIQSEDLVIDGAMTDPKGDRALSPSLQADPDLYLHVVSKTNDGIIVRGAKAHQTGICNSHEILVMPTVAMKAGEEDYAVSFAVPSDTKGITIVIGRQSCDTRKLEGGCMDAGNCRYGGVEGLIIFDDVFIPNERIFMNGEVEFAGMLVERFATYHRQSYGGCKTGVGDVLIGAAALSAEANGVAQKSHVKDKIIEMVHLNETMYACGIACSTEGHATPSGNYEPDALLANVCKQNVTRFPYEIARLSQDIAGGIMVTMPSEKDLLNEKTGALVRKYLEGASSFTVTERMKIMRLIENLTLGSAAVGYLTESMHGAGSPQAQRIMIARHGGIEKKKSYAKELLEIPEKERRDV